MYAETHEGARNAPSQMSRGSLSGNRDSVTPSVEVPTSHDSSFDCVGIRCATSYTNQQVPLVSKQSNHGNASSWCESLCWSRLGARIPFLSRPGHLTVTSGLVFVL